MLKTTPENCGFKEGFLAIDHVEVKKDEPGNNNAQSSANWTRPVPRKFPITSDHGKRRSCSNCSNPHQGIDYGSPSGTTVVAVGNGQAVYKGWLKGYGNVFIMHHPYGKGYTSRLAHNSKFVPTVQTGVLVKAGQAVAISGCTGTCFGAHVHFDLIAGLRNSYYYRATTNPHYLTGTPYTSSDVFR